MRQLGYGKDYEYAHASEEYQAQKGELPPAERLQSYLPENIAKRGHFEPGSQGEESKLVDWIKKRRRPAK